MGLTSQPLLRLFHLHNTPTQAASSSCGPTSRSTTSRTRRSSSTSPPTRRWPRCLVTTASAPSAWPSSSPATSPKFPFHPSQKKPNENFTITQPTFPCVQMIEIIYYSQPDQHSSTELSHKDASSPKTGVDAGAFFKASRRTANRRPAFFWGEDRWSFTSNCVVLLRSITKIY